MARSSTTVPLILAAASVLGTWHTAASSAPDGGSGGGESRAASAALRERAGRGRFAASFVSHAVSWWSVPELVRRGRFLADEGCSAQAADLLLSMACSLDPSSVDAYFARARLKQTRGLDAEEACCLYEKVLQLDTAHLGAMQNYALLLHTPPLEVWDDAEELYERVLALSPGHASALANYGMLQEVRRDGKGGSKASDFLYEEAIRQAGGGTEGSVRGLVA